MANDNFFAAFDRLNQGLRDISTFNAINDANETVKMVKSSQMKDFEQRQAIQGVANDLATRLGSFGVDPRNAAQFGANMVPAAPPMAGSPEQAILNPGQYDDATVAKGQQMYDAGMNLKQQSLNIAKGKAAKSGEIDPMKLQKLRVDLKNDLDADRARTGNLGNISAKVYASQRLKAVALDKNGKVQNIPSFQMREVGTALATLISGSNVVGEHQINELVPKSAQGSAADFYQWFTGDPAGTGQKGVLELFVKTADREEKLAMTQMTGIQKKRLAAHGLLKQLDPKGYDDIVSGYMDNPFEAIDAEKKQQQGAGGTAHKNPNQIAPGITLRGSTAR